jgi:hypothetical protein
MTMIAEVLASDGKMASGSKTQPQQQSSQHQQPKQQQQQPTQRLATAKQQTAAVLIVLFWRESRELVVLCDFNRSFCLPHWIKAKRLKPACASWESNDKK